MPNEMPEGEVACRATPHEDLIREIMDCRVAKNERGHAAAREIAALRADLESAFDALGLAGVDRPMSLTEAAASVKAEVERLKVALDSICDAASDEVEHIPDGYYPIDAWSNGEEVVINGEPPAEDENYDEETDHNCDAMECSTLWHIIHRAPLVGTPHKRAEVSALVKQCAALAREESHDG